MEERENLYTVDGNVNWFSFHEKEYWVFLKKLKIQQPCNPAKPPLDIYLKKTNIILEKCTPMFTAALFIIYKILKQLKWPSIDEWTVRICIHTYTHSGILLSHKIWNFANKATWMDLKGIMWNESAKDKCYVISLICDINTKQMNRHNKSVQRKIPSSCCQRERREIGEGK